MKGGQLYLNFKKLYFRRNFFFRFLKSTENQSRPIKLSVKIQYRTSREQRFSGTTNAPYDPRRDERGIWQQSAQLAVGNTNNEIHYYIAMHIKLKKLDSYRSNPDRRSLQLFVLNANFKIQKAQFQYLKYKNQNPGF